MEKLTKLLGSAALATVLLAGGCQSGDKRYVTFKSVPCSVSTSNCNLTHPKNWVIKVKNASQRDKVELYCVTEQVWRKYQASELFELKDEIACEAT